MHMQSTRCIIQKDYIAFSPTVIVMQTHTDDMSLSLAPQLCNVESLLF